MTAQAAGSYKPSEHNFEVALERIGLPRERILHVAQSLYHDHVTAQAPGVRDGLDRPPARSPGERRDATGRCHAGRDVHGHGLVRRGGDRRLRTAAGRARRPAETGRTPTIGQARLGVDPSPTAAT